LSHPEFSVSVHDLDAAGRPFRFPIRPAWVREALEGTDVGPATSGGEIDGRVSRGGNEVVVRGTLRVDLTVACARCLEPAVVHVNEDLSALAVPSGNSRNGKNDEESENADDAYTLVYNGDELVLDELVRDELLLAIPMIPLCSETCPGIRPGT
jgi:uncharacterized protein